VLPGPTEIIACPECGAPATRDTLLSGNTFGARRWTDGKMVAPMLPGPPPLPKCHTCGELYWLEDAEALGEIELCRESHDGIDPSWLDAPGLVEPDEADILAALETGLGDTPEREKRARVLAWWRANDAARMPPGMEAWRGAIGPETRRNLEVLVDLFDEEDACERVMKAEALRELGQFDEARALLESADVSGFEDAAARILDAAIAGDAIVREILPDPGDAALGPR
jgi:hypothetical protein